MSNPILYVIVAIPSIIVIFGVFVVWPIIRRECGHYSARDLRMINWLEHEIITRPAHGMEAREITLTLLIKAGREPEEREEIVQETFPCEPEHS